METEYTSYAEWQEAATAAHPTARHNKPGAPGWVRGYGAENDEEYVTGPDMQSDVVAVWMTDDGCGWVGAGVRPAEFTEFKASAGLVFFAAELNGKRGEVRRFAADGDLPLHKVVDAAARVMGGVIRVKLGPDVSDKPDGAYIITRREVEAA